MTRTFRGLALAIGCLLAAGGCSTGSGTASTTGSTPDTDDGVYDRPTVAVTAQAIDPQRARAAVQQSLDLLSQSDWAGAWSLWSDAAQAQLPQQAFVDVISNCPQQASGTFTVTDVKASDEKTVVVTWTQVKADNSQAPGQTTAVYEDGAWHVVPDPAALAAYKAGHCA